MSPRSGQHQGGAGRAAYLVELVKAKRDPCHDDGQGAVVSPPGARRAWGQEKSWGQEERPWHPPGAESAWTQAPCLSWGVSHAQVGGEHQNGARLSPSSSWASRLCCACRGVLSQGTEAGVGGERQRQSKDLGIGSTLEE